MSEASWLLVLFVAIYGSHKPQDHFSKGQATVIIVVSQPDVWPTTQKHTGRCLEVLPTSLVCPKRRNSQRTAARTTGPSALFVT